MGETAQILLGLLIAIPICLIFALIGHYIYRWGVKKGLVPDEESWDCEDENDEG